MNNKMNDEMNNSNNNIHFLLDFHPHYKTNNKEDYKNDTTILIKNILGFLLFFLIFVILFPILIKSYKNEELLLTYMANIDLIATVISFKNGPFNINLFRYLYIDNRPLIGYFNQNIINYIVLLVISYIIIKTSIKANNIGDGIAKASLIFIFTYLFPGRIIYNGMSSLYKILNVNLNLYSTTSWFITFIFGLLFSLFFIILETFAIKMFYKSISKFYENKVFKLLDLK